MNAEKREQQPDVNRQLTLARRPLGTPQRTDFKLLHSPLPEPVDGEFLCRSILLSIDPYMRGRMNDASSYTEPVALGAAMVGATVSEVIHSLNARFPVGSIVLNAGGWQDYSVSNGDGVVLIRTAATHTEGTEQTPLSWALGVLGMPGLTAWVGLLDIGMPKAGETVVVSAATGAVGSIVGQLAKLRGCRVVGIAGSGLKCEYAIQTLGYDECVNHKSDSFKKELQASCEQGIDVYFESVGGKVMEAVMPLMNVGARIPLCGGISYYNLTSLPGGGDKVPVLMRTLLVQRIKLQGFIITDHDHRREEFYREMSQYLADGQVVYREDVSEGLLTAPEALNKVLAGGNFGKQVVRVGPDRYI